MNLYDASVAIAQSGYGKIHIDLCKKEIKFGKQIILIQGKLAQHKIIIGDDVYEFDNLIDEELDINKLYEQYKYSLPSESDDKRHYFKALPASKLTDAQLVYGMPRLEARVRLEAYILLASITKLLEWEDENKWFWQGLDKDFVLLKKYI